MSSVKADSITIVFLLQNNKIPLKLLCVLCRQNTGSDVKRRE